MRHDYSALTVITLCMLCQHTGLLILIFLIILVVMMIIRIRQHKPALPNRQDMTMMANNVRDRLTVRFAKQQDNEIYEASNKQPEHHLDVHKVCWSSLMVSKLIMSVCQ
jgi:ABC-type transport system involved in cytochrome bd biosynthesis fused ATPase/permease subunit